MVQENLLLFAISIATALLAATIIFLFKNRPLQLKLSSLGLFLSAALIALEVYLIEQFKTSNQLSKATYAWGSLVPIAMVILFILAIVHIRKDQKLVKSLDRLR